MKINNIIEILIDPISKEKLNYVDGILTDLDNRAKYAVESNVLQLVPPSIAINNYVQHYAKDAELFDYFEEQTCAATQDNENRLREMILSKLKGDLSGSVIADIGSGGGWAGYKLVNRCKMFISVDLSVSNLSKLHASISKDNFYAIQADAMNMPIADNSIDYIISSEVIEHLSEPMQFISEMYRILKPSGVLIISTPYKEHLQYSLCVHCNMPTPRNAHLHSFDENKLLELVASLDGTNVEFNIFGNKVLHLLRTYVLLRYLPLKLWLLVDTIANLIINKKEHIIAIITKKV